jgi:hypothetical protein
MDHAEYRLEKLRRKRGHLVVGSEREDLLSWRHSRERNRLMGLVWREMAQINKDTFAVDVLRDLERLDVVVSLDNEEAAD